MSCAASHSAASSPSVQLFRLEAYFYPLPLLHFSSTGVYSESSSFICLSGNESKMNRKVLTVWLVDHVTVAVYASDKQPPCSFIPASSQSKDFVCEAVTFFMWFILLSQVLGPWLPLRPVPSPSALTIPAFVFAKRSSILPEGWPPLSLQGPALRTRPDPGIGWQRPPDAENQITTPKLCCSHVRRTHSFSPWRAVDGSPSSSQLTYQEPETLSATSSLTQRRSRITRWEQSATSLRSVSIHRNHSTFKCNIFYDDFSLQSTSFAMVQHFRLKKKQHFFKAFT